MDDKIKALEEKIEKMQKEIAELKEVLEKNKPNLELLDEAICVNKGHIFNV